MAQRRRRRRATRAMRRYARLEAEFTPAAATPPRRRPRTIAASLGLPDRVLGQPLHTLSGGQRRRVELARILFSGAETLLLDEPTNHLDADSIVWLRDFLRSHTGRAGRDQPRRRAARAHRQPGLPPRRQPRRARRLQRGLEGVPASSARPTSGAASRERANAEKKAAALMLQADKMRAKATKAVAAQNMARRAERLLAGLEDERRSDKVARLRFPEPAPCGKTPLRAAALSQSYGSLEVFTDVDLAIDRGSRVVVLGLNGAGKTTLLRILAGVDQPDTGEVEPGHGLQARLLRAGARDARPVRARCCENMHAAAPGADRHRGPQRARLVPVLRRRRVQAGRGAVRRGEDPAGAGDPGRVGRQRAAARRAHQQPRPRQPGGGARTRSAPSPARSCSSPTTRARCRRWSRNGCCCCPTASRTSGTADYADLVRWPEPSRIRPTPSRTGSVSSGASHDVPAVTAATRVARHGRRPYLRRGHARRRRAPARPGRRGGHGHADPPEQAQRADLRHLAGAGQHRRRRCPSTYGSWCCARRGHSFSAGLDRRHVHAGGSPRRAVLVELAGLDDDELDETDRGVPGGLQLVAAVRRWSRSPPCRAHAVGAGFQLALALRPAGAGRRRAVRDARDLARARTRPRRHQAAGRRRRVLAGAGDLRDRRCGRTPPRRSSSGWPRWRCRAAAGRVRRGPGGRPRPRRCTAPSPAKQCCRSRRPRRRRAAAGRASGAGRRLRDLQAAPAARPGRAHRRR